jgi:phosphoglycerate dehydrogenase-like enzyme
VNILIQRNLPEEVLDTFAQQFAHHDIRVIKSEDSIDEHLEWANIILSNPDPQTILNKALNLKWIQLLSSGFDGYESFKTSPFLVTTAYGIHPYIIAQHVLMMMLILERKHRFFEQRQRERTWVRAARLPGILRAQTLGLVGFGATARELVKLVKPFGLKILAVEKSPKSRQEIKEVQVEGMNCFDELLSNSDHIVIALPSTHETKGIVNADRLRKVKQGAYFYNVARGDLVDESTLIELLQNGHIAGAALDVFENEPLDSDSPFWAMDNCFITPHIAGHHKGLDIDVLELFSENLKRFDNDEQLMNLANFEQGY